MRNRAIRTNFTIPEEFQVSFEVYLNSKRDGWRNIFALTNTTNNKGNHGDRIFVLALANEEGNNNTFRFFFSVGDDPTYSYLPSDEIPVQEWMNITAKQANFSGTYKLQVFINGSIVHEVQNPSPNVYEGVIAYASREFERPVDGMIRNLLILPGKDQFFSLVYCTYLAHILII